MPYGRKCYVQLIYKIRYHVILGFGEEFINALPNIGKAAILADEPRHFAIYLSEVHKEAAQ